MDAQLEIVQAVALSDCLNRPVYYLDDECYWCGEDVVKTLNTPYDEHGHSTRGFSLLRHAPDCTWIAARDLLGLPLQLFSGPEPWATMHLGKAGM